MSGSGTSVAGLLRVGGFVALIGAGLLAVGVFWLSIGTGAIEWTSTLPGMIGVLLVTGSLLCLYPFIATEGGSGGIPWSTLGVAVTLLSLLAIVLVVFVPGSSSRILTTGWIIVFWIRPLGIVLFAFALVRADVLFGRALLLFAIAFAELPLLANMASATGAEWTMLVFGIPDLQPGLVSAILWAGFGYSMLILGRKESGGDDFRSGIPPLIRP